MKIGKRRDFSPEEIREILGMKDTHTASNVAQFYGVSASSIYKIWQRLTYTNIPEPKKITAEEIQGSLDRIVAELNKPDSPEDKEENTPRHFGCTGEGCEVCARADRILGRKTS